MGVKKKATDTANAATVRESQERKVMEVQSSQKLVDRLKLNPQFAGFTKTQIAELIKAMFTEIKEEVIANERCLLNGFGQFTSSEVAERKRHITFANIDVTTPAYVRLNFKPTSSMTLK